MLTDYAKAWQDLKKVVLGKRSHGSDALLIEMARLETRHEIDEGLIERALRLYGVCLSDDLLRPLTNAQPGDRDGLNAMLSSLESTTRPEEDMHHAHRGSAGH